MRLRGLVEKGLEATASLFAPIETASLWVEKAASLLENRDGADVLLVRRDYRQLLAEVGVARKSEIPLLAEAATQFLKVSRSYWSGLFHCYWDPDLPRTNNACEQGFGSFRYSERRATGRKITSAATVLRGEVRFVAATLRPRRPFEGDDLRPHTVSAWRELRASLTAQQELRRQQGRFRRDPTTFLADIEERLLKVILPT
jgi:hypothetical protein